MNLAHKLWEAAVQPPAPHDERSYQEPRDVIARYGLHTLGLDSSYATVQVLWSGSLAVGGAAVLPPIVAPF